MLRLFAPQEAKFCYLSKESVTNRREITKRVTEQHEPDGKIKYLWGYSSVGRAFEWHSKGQGFDSPYLHQ